MPTTQFEPDALHLSRHRKRTAIWLVISILLLFPGVAGLGLGFLLQLIAPSYAATPMVVGMCSALTLGLPGLIGLIVAAGLAFEPHTRLELSDGQIRIPGSRVHAIHTHYLKDGYRYAARVQQVLICVPTTRVIEVRRVVDPNEQPLWATPRRSGSWGVLFPFALFVRSRGYQLSGPSAAEDAPKLLAEELKRSWVTDITKTVAITFDALKADGNPWAAMPKHLKHPTVYVSVEDPDRLVAELQKLVAGS